MSPKIEWEEKSYFTIVLIIAGKVNTKSTMTGTSNYGCSKLGFYEISSNSECAIGKADIRNK